MGYFVDWGDYSDISSMLLSKVDDSLEKKGLSIRKVIENIKIADDLNEHHDEVKAWGTENLSGMWSIAYAKEGSDRYMIVYFELEEDFMGFKLAWL